MLRLNQIFFLIILFYSCNDDNKNSYAIKDFRPSLQPFLYEIVTKGIVTHHNESKEKSISDKELMRLGKSENPVLRATALVQMIYRSSFDNFKVVMNHLDDTAIVAVDKGEFGIGFSTVSDHLIYRASWEKFEDRNQIIQKVLTRHNYLRAAYTVLKDLEPDLKYYPYIKDMATRPRRLDFFNGIELGFDEIEYALYGVAKFRKRDDVPVIKEKLMEYVYDLSDISFDMMKEYPDTAWLDVLQAYHRRQFYKFSGNRPHGFSGFNADRAAPEDFIKALAAQENERSAKLLDSMLTFLPRMTCMPDKEDIINELIKTIWEHPCAAYTHIRKKITPKAKEILAGILHVKQYSPPDTAKPVFYWDNLK